MTTFCDLPIHRRVQLIEDALAEALNRGDFEITHVECERFLQPILAGHVMPDAVWSVPLLSLDVVAREVERLLS